ncbi:MAG: phosphopyruvate hydratase [Balneolaceae bacterium]
MPTIEVEVELSNGVKATAIVPSGASTGKYEALELRDNIPERFRGMSVNRAIDNIRKKISPILRGIDVQLQKQIDQLMIELDGTPNKIKLGANAMVGVSMAVARASAKARQLPLFQSLTGGKGNLLPLPEIQLIGGGAHSAGRIDVQDFMIICMGATYYEQCLEMTFNIYRECGEILSMENRLAGVADEGGYWPVFDNHEDVFRVILKAIESAGYQPGKDVYLSLDIAASELFSDGKYHMDLEKKSFFPDEFYQLISDWCETYPIISIEDPFAETDHKNWTKLTQKFGKKLQIIGDDLFVTDRNRVRKGYEMNLANSVLIKLNQIGTVSETLDCIRYVQSIGWRPVISARSGETEDPFISHLAVAVNAGQLKVGSFSRSERMVKWNEVLRIERLLGVNARFAGDEVFNSFL